jgi:putative serine protease PepD
VVATSLIAGGGAGVAGASAWGHWHPTHDGSTAAAAPRTTSSVVSTTPSETPDGSVESAAAAVLPSVVKIDVAGPTEQGSGSGIILSSDGEILTNNHVVEVAGTSGQITIEFNDGTHAPAKVLGTDPLTDTAVVQAEGVNGLKPATIGKSAEAKVGQEVVAIGSPMGLNATVTSGIVSALDRPVNVGSDNQGNTTVYPAIQTDAAINPGNSGGALVDLAGHVIGINSSILTTNSSVQSEAGSIGLGFAIPIDEVMPLIDEMAQGETPTHARLGISVENAGTASGAQVVDGATIRQVNSGSAAESAGLQNGDVITKIDDHLISDADALVATIRSYRPGDSVRVTYTRGGDSHTVTIKLDSDSTASNS